MYIVHVYTCSVGVNYMGKSGGRVRGEGGGGGRRGERERGRER